MRRVRRFHSIVMPIVITDLYRSYVLDDELQNVNLAEHARTTERLDLKKRGKTAQKYTGFDDEEFDPSNTGKSRGVLSKYDEIMSGEARDGEGFRLGGSGLSVGTSARKAEKEHKQERELNRDLLSLDYSSW